MTVQSLGSLSMAAAVPGATAAVIAGIVGVNLVLPDIEARVAALQAFAPQPVSFVAQLAIAQGTLGSIQAALSLGLPVPDISAQIAMVAALVAELLATLSQVNAQLAVLTNLEGVLNADASVAAYVYDGTIGALGGELGAAVGGGGGHANALALVATDSVTWAALSALLKVSA